MDSATITMDEYCDTAEVFKENFEKTWREFEKEVKKAERKRDAGPTGEEWEWEVLKPKTD